jgi:hypothetical protein
MMKECPNTLDTLTNEGNTLFGTSLNVKIDNKNKELIIKKQPMHRTYSSTNFSETFVVPDNEDIDSYCVIPFRGWVHSNERYLDKFTENFIVKNSINSHNNNFMFCVSMFLDKLNMNLC